MKAAKETNMNITRLAPLFLLFLLAVQPAFSQLTTKSKTQVWLTGGWGGGEVEFADDSHNLLGIGLLVQRPGAVAILRAERGWGTHEGLGREYRVNEWKGLYGYSKAYGNHRLYVAGGLSYAMHTNRLLTSKSRENGNNLDAQEWNFWGVPLEAGLQISLAQPLAISASMGVNINEHNAYVSYLIGLQYRLF